MKKHLLPLIAIVTLLITVFTLTFASAYAIGDVDGNGTVAAADARKALRASVKLETLTPEQEKAADVDGVPGVSASDARRILRVSVKLEVFEEPHTHSYVGAVTKKATCTENGVKTFSCSCGEGTYTENIPATGHSYDTGIKTLPTCTSDGYTTYTCKSCSHSYKGNAVAAKGHTEVKDVAVKPTCVNTGLTEGKHCSVCNSVLVAQTTVSALGHNKINHSPKTATCTEKGWNAYETCSRCDYSTYAEKPALGHNEVPHAAKPQSCLDIGWDAYVTCSRCSYTTYAEKPALGHNEVPHAAKPQSCLDIGWDAYVTCSRCDYSTYAEKPALGHNEIPHEAKPQSCLEIGWDAYVTCSRCDYSTYAEKPALGHSTGEVGDKEATCLENGYCTRCESDLIAPGHDLVSKTVENSCTEDGYTADVCTRCEYYENKETPEHLKAPGTHAFDEVNIKVVDPTCTERGYKEKRCTRTYTIIDENGEPKTVPCVTEKYDFVDPLGHDYEWTEDVKASCKQAGSRSGKCKVCGDTKTEEISIKPHTPARIAEGLPGEKGTDNFCKLVIKCTVCGEVLHSKDNDGHVLDYSTYVPNELPEDVSPCIVDSTATVGCMYCDYVNEEFFVAPAPGHQGNIASIQKATCTEPGWMDIDECTVCGEEFHDGYTIPATGHVYSGVATCTADVICTVCQAVVVPRLGHEFTMHAAAYNTEIEQFFCSRCGTVTDDTLTTFNNIANKIKSSYFLETFNRTKPGAPQLIRFSKSSAKTAYSRFDFGIYTSAIKNIYDESMSSAPDTYTPIKTSGTLRNMFPLEYSSLVSLLESGDATVKAEKLNGINVRNIITQFPDTYTVGSSEYNTAQYKKNINEDIIKVTIDVKNETYSQVKAYEPNKKTALQKALGLDIREDAKAFKEDEKGRLILTEVDSGDGYSVTMTMELLEISSDAIITYYFAADTYEPVLAVYNAKVGTKQTIDMDFSIGVFSLDGVMDPSIDTDYSYVYLFPNFFA